MNKKVDKMNELFLFCILIIGIVSLILADKYLHTLGLKIVILTFSTLSLILSFKTITLSTLQINANIVTYIIMYLALCLLIEQNKIKESKNIIKFNFILAIFSSIILYIMAYYTQSLNDTIGINMKNVFIENSRILIAFPISTLISQEIFIYIYLKVKKIYDNLFISAVTSYLAAALIDAIIYNFTSYYKILNIDTIIKILLSTYMIKLIIMVIYSIILTLLNKRKVKK